MVDMVLVGKERAFVVANSVRHNADYVEARQYQRGESEHKLVEIIVIGHRFGVEQDTEVCERQA